MFAGVIHTRPIFYGWWVALGGLLAAAVGSGLTFWSFTVYIRPLEESFGWSRGEVSGAFSVGVVAWGVGSPVAGRALDRFGARRSFVFGALAIAGSFLLLSQMQTLWQFYLAYSFHNLVLPWVLYVPIHWLLAQWFRRRRGAAIGVASAGFGVGGIVFPLVVERMVSSLGWSTSFVLSAAIIAATYLPLAALVFRNRPADLGLLPDGDSSAAQPQPEETTWPGRRWTAAQVIRSPLFWSLSLAFLLFFSASDSFIVHAIPFFESVGISARQGAAVISYTAAVATVVGLTAGFFLDRLSNLRPVAVGVCAAKAGGLLLLILSVDTPSVAGFVVLWGLGGGAGSILQSLLVARAFGPYSFGTILGMMLLVESVGYVTGPLLGGVLFDVLGSYTVPFLLYVGFSAGAGVTFLLAVGGHALHRERARMAHRDGVPAG